jgi:hypothetical protein
MHGFIARERKSLLKMSSKNAKKRDVHCGTRQHRYGSSAQIDGASNWQINP